MATKESVAAKKSANRGARGPAARGSSPRPGGSRAGADGTPRAPSPESAPLAGLTLDQARALDALERRGTFQAAASELHKSHSAVIYAVRAMEEQTGLALLDRSAYRTRLTAAGARVLAECRKLLVAERELAAVCRAVRTGWEPRLCVVLDGIFPTAPMLAAVAGLVRGGAPTRVEVRSEFLDGVEEAFVREEADLMVAVLPPRALALRAVPLPPIRASLVAHRSHPLARAKALWTRADLAAHVLLTVRGSDPRLVLPTSGLEVRGAVHLSDFAAKKEAILAGVGFGWLPHHSMEAELARGDLVPVKWSEPSEHVFEPRLFHRADVTLGRAAAKVVEALGG